MKKRILALVVSMALVLSPAGCAGKTDRQAAEEDGQATVTGVSEPEAIAGRQNGERFEDVIVLEGMEESVRYEHIRNAALGFEMDYDYELFTRYREPDRDCFLSICDDPEKPENYLEITYSPEAAEAVSAAISDELAKEYDVIKEPFLLDRAGGCIKLDASAEKGSGGTPDRLQTVYIIPASDGCRIAAAHYSFESAEGFGRRFSYFMNSLMLMRRHEGKALSDEQALSAVKSYCRIGNPALADIENDGNYPVYWDISSSDEQQIAVLFRSYTGTQLLYRIDRMTGNTYASELVPEAGSAKEPAEECCNAWDYLP